MSAVMSGEAVPVASLAELIQGHLREQYRALVRGDVELRRGGDAIHATRIATRRFRSVLRVFDLFDPDRAARLDAELKWYAGVLGDVRDLQVLRSDLLSKGEALPEEVRADTVEYLSARLDEDERAERAEVLDLLEGARYRALLSDLRAFVEQPPGGGEQSADAVHRYVKRARRKAAKRLAAAARPPQDDDRTHRARKAAKRARYTAELAVPVLGEKAEHRAERQHEVQDELGQLQDAVVASAYLERITSRAGGTAGFGLGLLWHGEQQRAFEVRRNLAALAN